MKGLKLVTTTLFITSLAVSSFAQVVEKTLVQSLNIDHQKEITFDVPSEISTQQWNKDYVRVEMKLSLAGYNPNVLKALIASGRYRLSTNMIDGQLVITAADMKKEVRLGGQKIEDIVTYNVNVPKGVIVKQLPVNDDFEGIVRAEAL